MINIDPPSSSLDLSLLSKSGLSRFLKRARTAVGLDGEVDVLLCSDAEIKRLNKAFRGKNKATDVLSFPAPPEVPGVAGDLAISLDTAARQAAEHGHELMDEVRILLLHGLLHLAGEDHELDSGEMAAREAELRQKLKLSVGLIERVSRAGARPARKKAARKKAAGKRPVAGKAVPGKTATKAAAAKKTAAKRVAGGKATTRKKAGMGRGR